MREDSRSKSSQDVGGKGSKLQYNINREHSLSINAPFWLPCSYFLSVDLLNCVQHNEAQLTGTQAVTGAAQC